MSDTQSPAQASDTTQPKQEQTALDVANANAARVDAALDKALKGAGIDLPDDESSKAPARDEQGRFAKKPESTTDGGDSTEAKATDGSPASEEDETAESKFTDDEIRKAVAAAQRVTGKDKLPKKIDELIKSGDEDTINYYLKLAKVQQDGDDFSKKHKTLQQELDQLKNRPAANSGESVDDATASQARIDKLADYLAEFTGDDKAKELVRESLAGLAKPAASSSELDAVKQQNAALQKQVEELAIDRARDALVSEYPDLKDKSVWEKVKSHLPSLPESDERPDLQTRLEHAARIELAPEMIRREKAERERRNKVRDAGTPSAPARGVDSKPTLTVDQLHDAYLDAQERGDEAKVKEIRATLQARQRK